MSSTLKGVSSVHSFEIGIAGINSPSIRVKEPMDNMGRFEGVLSPISCRTAISLINHSFGDLMISKDDDNGS